MSQEEAEALTALLERQREAILETFEKHRQQRLDLQIKVRDEQEQFERDRRYMEARLREIEEELVREPEALTQGYEVVLSRFEPLGLVYLWPRS